MTKGPTKPDSAVVASPATLLVVGATGSIGRLVVAEALRQGYAVRALVRDEAKARRVLAPASRRNARAQSFNTCCRFQDRRVGDGAWARTT